MILHLTIYIAVKGVKGFVTAEEECFKAVHEIWETILSIEPHKTPILPWLEPIHGMGRRLPSLRQGVTFPVTRNSMEACYVAEWKLAWFSDQTILRFIVGQDKPIQFYLEHPCLFNRLEVLEATLLHDKLQPARTATAVWFAGPLPQHSTPDMIGELLLVSPRFQKQDISMLHLQIGVIRTSPGQLPRNTPLIKAIHAVCAASEKSRVRKVL
jgi:hypothetical protein